MGTFNTRTDEVESAWVIGVVSRYINSLIILCFYRGKRSVYILWGQLVPDPSDMVKVEIPTFFNYSFWIL